MTFGDLQSFESGTTHAAWPQLWRLGRWEGSRVGVTRGDAALGIIAREPLRRLAQGGIGETPHCRPCRSTPPAALEHAPEWETRDRRAGLFIEESTGARRGRAESSPERESVGTGFD